MKYVFNFYFLNILYVKITETIGESTEPTGIAIKGNAPAPDSLISPVI